MEANTSQQQEKKSGMRPIWYFVGWVLGLMGGVILLAGIYYLYNPQLIDSELAYLHPNIWWGGFMVLCGFLFWLYSRNIRIE